MMDNPQAESPVSIKTMYRYDNKTNIPWNISQYQLPVNHYDHKKIVNQRLYASQKKGVKVNDFYVTKRGYYMDYQLKVAKGIPSSVQHIDQKPWDGTHHELQGDKLKQMRTSSKFTIYDRMDMRQKKHPVPAVGKYNLEKSLQQIEKMLVKNQTKKLSFGEKRYFHMNDSYLSQQSPGAGNYCPNQDVPIQKIRKSKGDPKFWIAKDEKWNNIVTKRQMKKPAPSTYNPLHQSFTSFASIQKLQKKTIKNGFGSDARFPYVRPNKKIIIEKRPSPDAYETKIVWRSRNTSPKTKQWFKMIWKGSPSKVYS